MRHWSPSQLKVAVSVLFDLERQRPERREVKHMRVGISKECLEDGELCDPRLTGGCPKVDHSPAGFDIKGQW